METHVAKRCHIGLMEVDAAEVIGSIGKVPIKYRKCIENLLGKYSESTGKVPGKFHNNIGKGFYNGVYREASGFAIYVGFKKGINDYL